MNRTCFCDDTVSPCGRNWYAGSFPSVGFFVARGMLLLSLIRGIFSVDWLPCFLSTPSSNIQGETQSVPDATKKTRKNTCPVPTRVVPETKPAISVRRSLPSPDRLPSCSAQSLDTQLPPFLQQAKSSMALPAKLLVPHSG